MEHPRSLLNEASPAYSENEPGSSLPVRFDSDNTLETSRASTGTRSEEALPDSLTEDLPTYEPTEDLPGYAQESVLLRGLQVPSKSSYLSSGFKYPKILNRAGVSADSWMEFTNEIKQYAKMDASQWLTTIGGALGTWAVGSMIIGFLTFVPAAVIGHKMRKHREEANFLTAEQTGTLAACVKRWNDDYFRGKGLVVRVDIPGYSYGMDEMDISTSKAFKKRAKSGATSPNSPTASDDGKARVKAAHKGRIVIIPLDKAALSSPSDSPKRAEGPMAYGEDSAQGESAYLTDRPANDASREEDLSMFGREWKYSRIPIGMGRV